jgi:hypothetical protein
MVLFSEISDTVYERKWREVASKFHIEFYQKKRLYGTNFTRRKSLKNFKILLAIYIKDIYLFDSKIYSSSWRDFLGITIKGWRKNQKMFRKKVV